MPPTFDLMVHLHRPMLLIPYNSSTLPFPDHPYSTYRLHLALALLTHMGLIEFDRCVLDPTTPWKFYLKHLHSEKCEKTFLVLRHFHQILPHFMWQSFPLIQCSVTFSKQASLPLNIQHELYREPMPIPLQLVYQGGTPPWNVHVPENPTSSWLTRQCAPPTYHIARPLWLDPEDNYACQQPDATDRHIQHTRSTRRDTPNSAPSCPSHALSPQPGPTYDNQAPYGGRHHAHWDIPRQATWPRLPSAHSNRSHTQPAQPGQFSTREVQDVLQLPCSQTLNMVDIPAFQVPPHHRRPNNPPSSMSSVDSLASSHTMLTTPTWNLCLECSTEFHVHKPHFELVFHHPSLPQNVPLRGQHVQDIISDLVPLPNPKYTQLITVPDPVQYPAYDHTVGLIFENLMDLVRTMVALLVLFHEDGSSPPDARFYIPTTSQVGRLTLLDLLPTAIHHLLNMAPPAPLSMTPDIYPTPPRREVTHWNPVPPQHLCPAWRPPPPPQTILITTHMEALLHMNSPWYNSPNGSECTIKPPTWIYPPGSILQAPGRGAQNHHTSPTSCSSSTPPALQIDQQTRDTLPCSSPQQSLTPLSHTPTPATCSTNLADPFTSRGRSRDPPAPTPDRARRAASLHSLLRPISPPRLGGEGTQILAPPSHVPHSSVTSVTVESPSPAAPVLQTTAQTEPPSPAVELLQATAQTELTFPPWMHVSWKTSLPSHPSQSTPASSSRSWFMASSVA